MKRTVSSFTSEHLQQSLQHCNGNIPHYGSTGYGGRSSATGNTHLPQHRDRCGRWILTHLQQERTDFHMYGLPLQMCMWFYMTRQKYRQQWLLWWMGWRVKTPYLHVLTNIQMRQGRFFNAPRRIHEFLKEFSSKHQGLFQKVLHLFEKVLSSVWGIIFRPG